MTPAIVSSGTESRARAAATPAPEVVVFGLGRLSALAAYVLAHDSPWRPVAFTVHERFASTGALAGLPVVAFERLEQFHPPARCALLVPLGWRRMGGLRADVVREGRSKGYRCISYVSSRALTWPDLDLGDNCMVYEGTVVQPYGRIGEGCIVRSGVTLSHDVVVGDYSFVAAGVVVGGRAVIGEHCVLGLGSTVCTGVRVAPRCFVAAGAVVTSDTLADGIYRGNPARRSRVTSDRIDRLDDAR